MFWGLLCHCKFIMELISCVLGAAVHACGRWIWMLSAHGAAVHVGSSAL